MIKRAWFSGKGVKLCSVPWVIVVLITQACMMEKRPNSHVTPVERPSSPQVAAFKKLKEKVPHLEIDFDTEFATPKQIFVRGGFLTTSQAEPTEGEGISLVKQFVAENPNLFEHGPEIFEHAVVLRDYITSHNGLRTIVWQQQFEGMPVEGAVFTAHLSEWNEVVSLSSRFLPDIKAAAARGTPNMSNLLKDPITSASGAITKSMKDIGIPLRQTMRTLDLDKKGFEQALTQSNQIAPFKPVMKWLPVGKDKIRPCWNVIVTDEEGFSYSTMVDVETGEELRRIILTRKFDQAFRVFPSDSPSPFSPGHSSPTTNQPPILGAPPFYSRLLIQTNTTSDASPLGWVNPAEKRTRGNNIDAFDASTFGSEANPDSRPQGAVTNGVLTFDFPLDLASPPRSEMNSKAAVVNAFYWCNWMHDKLYSLGFTEAAGNMQNDNFGKGGLGGDALKVRVHDSDRGGASMTIFEDGTPSLMFLNTWPAPEPDRSSALDTEVMIHEYTHALVWRMIPGWRHSQEVDALIHCWYLDEGWPDFMAIALLSEEGDDPTGTYPFAGYGSHLWTPRSFGPVQANYYYGAREFPYSTDKAKNPLTFGHLRSDAPAPAVPINPAFRYRGSTVYFGAQVWATALFQVRAKLIEKHGFAQGNQLMLQLVVDGIRMTPTRATFLQARDAILLADLVNNRGANHNEIWKGFAERGMGWSASVPNNDPQRTDVSEAFDLPPPNGERWRFTVGGGIYSSPAVAVDGTIYFGSLDRHLYAITPDGGLKWRYRTDGAVNSSPLLALDGTIYVGSNDGRLHAVDQKGHRKWVTENVGVINSSPVMGFNGWIFFGSVTGNKVFGFEGQSKRWERSVGNTVYASPVIGHDGTVYIGGMDGHFYGFDPVTGENKAGWPKFLGAPVSAAGAVGSRGEIYVGSHEGSLYSFTSSGAELWKFSSGARIDSAPVIGPDGTIYFANWAGRIFALNEDGSLKWQKQLINGNRSTPALGKDGTLVVGAFNTYIYGFDAEDGSQEWVRTGIATALSSPAIGPDGTIYVGSQLGRLTAFGNVGGLAESPWPMFQRNGRHDLRDWLPLKQGIEPGAIVSAVAISPGTEFLTVGGNFDQASSTPVQSLTIWDGNEWDQLGGGVQDGFLEEIFAGPYQLAVGGRFSSAGGASSPNFARFRFGSGWQQSSISPDGTVFAITQDSAGRMIVGGNFLAVGQLAANNIAAQQSNGSWQILGTPGNDGVTGTVYALAADEDNLYVGGSFTRTFGTTTSGNIAQWDGANWLSLGSTDGPIFALATSQSNVYAGGSFTRVYTGSEWKTISHIAKWSNGDWTQVGSGLNGVVHALATDGDMLFAGGNFTFAGEQAVTNVAVWDGSRWLPLGSGANGIVRDIALTKNYIYIGGQFSAAGGTPVYGIAKWHR